MTRNALLFILIIISAAACKQKSPVDPNPCGDPPPVAEAPAMRVIDKATGKDYFIQNPGMQTKLAVKRMCTTQPVTAAVGSLKNNGAVYGYVIHFSYLPLLNVADSCKKVIWTWEGKDDDTVMYYTHKGTCKEELDSIYFNGAKLQRIVDSMASTTKSYYTVIK